MLDEFIHQTGQSEHWEMVELVLNSSANTAIIPLQDLLGFEHRETDATESRPLGLVRALAQRRQRL